MYVHLSVIKSVCVGVLTFLCANACMCVRVRM